jgi:glycosyltransferase involved in cell wall biosynthesis
MYQGDRIAVVVPAYNEAGLIGEVLDDIPEFVDRTYVVDDASTDGTWEEIMRRVPDTATGRQRVTVAPDAQVQITDGGSETGDGTVQDADGGSNTGDGDVQVTDGGVHVDRRLVPIRHETNRGRGAAVKTGYRRALAGGIDAIAVMDGDGQMDPGILERFVEPVVTGRADYAKGNRLLSRDHRAGMSRWRQFGNDLLSYLTKVSSGYWRMMDPQNGYTVIAAGTLRSLELDDLYDGYGFLNDMLVRLNVADARIVDVAMQSRYGDEESGIRYSSFVPRLSVLLLRDFLWRLRTKYLLFDFHPLVGLYLLGFTALAGGLVYVGWTATSSPTAVNLLLSFVVLLLSGTLLTFAMIFDRAHNVNLEDRITDTSREGGR